MTGLEIRMIANLMYVTVANIAEVAFYILGILAFIKYLRTKSSTNGAVLIGLFFFCQTMFKKSIVT